MLIDSRKLSDKQMVTADICIVGAGPAGTTLANEFLGKGVKVIVLESGGTGAESRIQKLSEGELGGVADEAPELTHLRQLGGTANHWIIKMSDKQYGYRYAPLSEIDFKKRDYLPYSGWPITRADLDRYYVRAHKVARVGPYRYEPGNWETDQFKPLPLDSNRARTHFFSFGPTSVFTKELPDKFARSDNVDVYIHATVVELLTDHSGAVVEGALVRTFAGKEITFKAKYFVVAAGGYTTPRLLLSSRRKFENGIGNQHDVVGRYYMDHSLVPSGNLYLNDPRIINNLGLYDMRLMQGASVLGALSVNEELMLQEQLRSFSATLFPMPPLKDVEGLLSLKDTLIDLKARKFPNQLPRRLLKMYGAKNYISRVLYQRYAYDAPVMPGFGQGGWSRLKDNHQKFHRVEMLAFAEQAPSPNNRISLIGEKDELGCPRIKVHFDWDEAGLNSILRSQQILGEELVKTGLGRFEPCVQADGRPVIGAQGLHHLMGTTRMSEDPKFGVVDRHCRVHGTANLFIASSSVFATSGYANPTLTILAFSIRVADRVKQLLVRDLRPLSRMAAGNERASAPQ